MGVDLEFIIGHSFSSTNLVNLPSELNNYFSVINLFEDNSTNRVTTLKLESNWKWQEVGFLDSMPDENIEEWCKKQWIGISSEQVTLYFAANCFLGTTGHRWKWMTVNPLWRIDIRKIIELLGLFFGSSGAIIYPDSLSLDPRPDKMAVDGSTLQEIVLELTEQYGKPNTYLSDAYYQERLFVRSNSKNLKLNSWCFEQFEDTKYYQHLHPLYVELLQSIKLLACQSELSENCSKLQYNKEKFFQLKTKLQTLKHGLGKFQVALLNEFEEVLRGKRAGKTLQAISKLYNPSIDTNTYFGAAECLIEAFAVYMYGCLDDNP